MSVIDEIHQLIDTSIRQKTADGSIQKTDVADALDAIVDALNGRVGSVKFINGIATVPPNSYVTATYLRNSGASKWVTVAFGDAAFDVNMSSKIGLEDGVMNKWFQQQLFATEDGITVKISLVDFDGNSTFTLNNAPIPTEITGYVFYQPFTP